ncbi:hypothetical protein [Streptomyces scabiei]|uniref:hypothetical protein n=1 Tax=Streptomyces scabiei TaxID=1930 RepID=UPI0039F73D1F
MMRALGETAACRPSSGAFVSYAREFAETTAIALYLHYWEAFEPVPQWMPALISLALIVAVNMPHSAPGTDAAPDGTEPA